MNKYDFDTDTIFYRDHKIENFFADFTQHEYQKEYVKK
jgi:hypothetical protein